MKGLLLNHRGERCGVYQFGRRLFHALETANEIIEWQYAECGSAEEIAALEDRIRPDVLVVNYVPFTMPWITDRFKSTCGAVSFGVMHEAHQRSADSLSAVPFSYMLCPDPTLVARNPVALIVPRFMPDIRSDVPPPPSRFTVGSFGFATRGKGFARLCAAVCEQFDDAVIRINIPPHDSERMVSRSAEEAVTAECHKAITKEGITLEITDTFYDDEALLDFLAGNTINAFLYEEGAERGVSSCTDYALASGRPVAVSSSGMFRHLHGVNPSIVAEERGLADIAADGVKHLHRAVAQYESRAAARSWSTTIRDAVQRHSIVTGVPDGRGFNKLLDDRSRSAYGKALRDLSTYAPAMLERKIPEANIQQAFGLDAVERLSDLFPSPRILAVGSFEDTAVETLRRKGYRVDEIDPNVNGVDLGQFYYSNAGVLQSYDIVLSVSVLEHVEDDVTFVKMVSGLLAPGGVAILTVDFSNQYPVHGIKPGSDWRLYTTSDLQDRLMSAIPDCALLDPHSWNDGSDDFTFMGCRYSFASWVFQKLPLSQQRSSVRAMMKVGAPWKDGARADALTGALGAAQSMPADHQLAELIAERDALYQGLRLTGGPRALRLALPVARAIRSVSQVLGLSHSGKGR